MYEQEKFLLFPREHDPSENPETNPEQTLSVPYVFHKSLEGRMLLVEGRGLIWNSAHRKSGIKTGARYCF
jgi:hypothetical protein